METARRFLTVPPRFMDQIFTTTHHNLDTDSARTKEFRRKESLTRLGQLLTYYMEQHHKDDYEDGHIKTVTTIEFQENTRPVREGTEYVMRVELKSVVAKKVPL